MATRLLQVLASGSVAPGATAVLTHAINVQNTPVLPDYIVTDNANFTVLRALTTTTTITIRNDGGDSDSCNVWVERKHSIDRALGGAIQNLTPQPFVPAGGAGGSGAVGRLTSQYHPINSQEIRYIRSATGSDGNDGLTPATAWQTFQHGLEWFQIGNMNQSQILEVTGSTFSVSEYLAMGPQALGGNNPSLDFAATGPNDFAYRNLFQVRADLQLVVALTFVSSVQEPTTGLRTVTVAEALVVNAHIGQFLRGDGLAQGGVIVANTLNTITITNSANVAAWTNLGIYTYGATLEFGDPADFTYDTAIFLHAHADWFLGGLQIKSVGNAKGTALSVQSADFVEIQQCDIRGILFTDAAAPVTVDASYIHDAVYSHNGGALTMRNTLVRAMTAVLCHGSSGSGLTELLENVYDGNAGPYGGGNVESVYNFFADSCQFINTTGDGVNIDFATSRLVDCLASNNSGDGVQVDKHATAVLNNVQGLNNGGFGCRVQNGAQAQRLGASAVTGAAGDTKIGAIVAAVAWAATPATDVGEAIPQFCRIY